VSSSRLITQFKLKSQDMENTQIENGVQVCAFINATCFKAVAKLLRSLLPLCQGISYGQASTLCSAHLSFPSLFLAQVPGSASQPQEKQLRTNYRDLLQEIRRSKHDLESHDNNKIKATLEKANALQAQVTKPREQAMDSEIFNLITEHSVEYVRKLAQSGKSYSAADFLRRLKTRYVNDPDAQNAAKDDPSLFKWFQLGSHVAYAFKPAPVTFHMLGPMDSQPMMRKVGQRQRRRDPIGAATRPDEVEDLEDDDKQETDRNMEEMWKALGRQPDSTARLVDLVLNHKSYAQSLENLFTLSFLVRDARVELKECEERGIMVVKKDMKKGGGGGSKDNAAQEAQRVQFVMRMDMDTWEEWCTYTRAGECLMTHRKAYQPSGAGRKKSNDADEEEEEGSLDSEEEIVVPTKKRRKS
jgi:non-structural maintenance of chromosomes element 4